MTTTNKTELMEAALKAYNSTAATSHADRTLEQMEGTLFHRQLSAIVDKMVEMIQPTVPQYYVTASTPPPLTASASDTYVLAWHEGSQTWVDMTVGTIHRRLDAFTYWMPMPPTPTITAFERALAHFGKSIEGCTTMPSREQMLAFWHEAQAATKGEVR